MVQGQQRAANRQRRTSLERLLAVHPRQLAPPNEPQFQAGRALWLLKDLAPHEKTILVAKNETRHKSCATCAAMKKRPGKSPDLLQQVVDPSWPWEEIVMNFIVELPDSGNMVIWIMIDLFSKQAHFIACSGLPSAHKLTKLFIKHIYRMHGVPCRIFSDRGV